MQGSVASTIPAVNARKRASITQMSNLSSALSGVLPTASESYPASKQERSGLMAVVQHAAQQVGAERGIGRG